MNEGVNEKRNPILYYESLIPYYITITDPILYNEFNFVNCDFFLNVIYESTNKKNHFFLELKWSFGREF